MADIRDFHVVGKEENTESFRQKITRHRLNVLIRVAVVTVAVVLAVVFGVSHYKNQIYTDLVVSQRAEKVSLDTNSYLNNNGSVITYSKDGISSTDGSGKVLWNMTYEMQNPIVRTSAGIVAVCDYNGHLVYLINSDGKVSEIDTNLPIRDFCVSKESRVAAIIEDAGNSWVNLYDSNGNQLVEVKATMTKTGYPLAVTLSGEVMGVSYFYVDGDTMRSSVSFYNFGGIGENVSDHIVSSYDYADAVVPMVEFMDSETLFALADNRLMFYSGAKKPTSSSDAILNESIVGAYYGDTNIALIFYDTTGEHKYRMDLYEKTGKKMMSYAFDMDYKSVLIHNNQVMIYNENECIVLNSEGREKYVGHFPESVIFVSTTDSNKKYIAVTSDAIETISFE